jgi:galactose mutarotase-like enzyme
MIDLHNEFLNVSIDPKGAEMQMLCRKADDLNYLWKGDPAFWGKHSPVLFPIVGALRGNTYFYEGKSYTLPRHGFARDKVFEVISANPEEALFSLSDDEATHSVYPFPFVFRIRYRLDGPVLEVGYEVHNPGPGPLYFSVGGHPAFAVPLVEGTRYEDYTLTFSRPETAGRHVLQDGLLRDEETPFLQDQAVVRLTRALFAEDAVVLHGLRSQTVTLGSEQTERGLRFRILDWPDLGIWAAPGAPFVCIEPWQGHADPVDGNQQLVYKKGIVALEPGAGWARSWTVEPF